MVGIRRVCSSDSLFRTRGRREEAEGVVETLVAVLGIYTEYDGDCPTKRNWCCLMESS